jgi:hypothetical protein
MTEAQIRAALAEAAQALRLCSTGLRGMRVGKDDGEIRWRGGSGVKSPDGQSLEAVTRAMWPDYALESDELWYATWSGLLPGAKTRLQATNEQISKLDRVLPWLYIKMDPRWKRAVWVRADWTDPVTGRAAGWRRIGAELGCSHTTARVWERQGVEQIAKALQGQMPGVASWREDCQDPSEVFVRKLRDDWY